MHFHANSHHGMDAFHCSVVMVISLATYTLLLFCLFVLVSLVSLPLLGLPGLAFFVDLPLQIRSIGACRSRADEPVDLSALRSREHIYVFASRMAQPRRLGNTAASSSYWQMGKWGQLLQQQLSR